MTQLIKTSFEKSIKFKKLGIDKSEIEFIEAIQRCDQSAWIDEIKIKIIKSFGFNDDTSRMIHNKNYYTLVYFGSTRNKIEIKVNILFEKFAKEIYIKI